MERQVYHPPIGGAHHYFSKLN